MFAKQTCGLPSNRPWTVNLQSKYGRTVPTGFGENFDILLVGEDIILPPFIKIALCFSRTTGGRPYRFDCYPKFIVGRGGACSSRCL